MNIAYVVAECRPSTDEDGYADINIGDDAYIFCSIEPIYDVGDWQRNIQQAILIGIDIERTNLQHKIDCTGNGLMNGPSILDRIKTQSITSLRRNFS